MFKSKRRITSLLYDVKELSLYKRLYQVWVDFLDYIKYVVNKCIF